MAKRREIINIEYDAAYLATDSTAYIGTHRTYNSHYRCSLIITLLFPPKHELGLRKAVLAIFRACISLLIDNIRFATNKVSSVAGYR